MKAIFKIKFQTSKWIWVVETWDLKEVDLKILGRKVVEENKRDIFYGQIKVVRTPREVKAIIFWHDNIFAFIYSINYTTYFVFRRKDMIYLYYSCIQKERHRVWYKCHYN